jgi:hypothetical protein
MVASFKGTPMWTQLEALAPALVYDAHALGGDTIACRPRRSP